MSVGYDNLPVNFEQVLSLPMREATGVATAPTQDVARPHHGAVLVGPPTWAQNPVSNLTYMTFGAGDALTLAALATVPPTDMDFATVAGVLGGFSYAAWVRSTSLAAVQTLWCYGGATDGLQISVTMTNGEIQFITYQAAANQVTDTATACIVVDIWWFIAVTCDGAWDTGQARIYKNAIDVTLLHPSHISPLTAAARDAYVGAHDDQAGPPGAPELSLIGDIWNPRMWTRQLPQIEIWEIFEMERALFQV